MNNRMDIMQQVSEQRRLPSMKSVSKEGEIMLAEARHLYRTGNLRHSTGRNSLVLRKADLGAAERRPL